MESIISLHHVITLLMSSEQNGGLLNTWDPWKTINFNFAKKFLAALAALYLTLVSD